MTCAAHPCPTHKHLEHSLTHLASSATSLLHCPHSLQCKVHARLQPFLLTVLTLCVALLCASTGSNGQGAVATGPPLEFQQRCRGALLMTPGYAGVYGIWRAAAFLLWAVHGSLLHSVQHAADACGFRWGTGSHMQVQQVWAVHAGGCGHIG